MKAFVYDFKNSAKMRWEEKFVVAQPGKGEVLVKVIGAGLNPVDFKVPEIPPMRWGRDLKPVGSELSGKVEAVGEGVRNFQVGDLVWGFTSGSLAPKVITNESKLFKIPETCDSVGAGAWAIAACTALQSLRAGGCIGGESAKKILILGASGGVGHLAVQIAKALNPKGTEVVGVCSTKNLDFVKSLGATEVFDYTRSDFDLPKTVKNCDMVFDCVTPVFKYEPIAMQCLKPNGQYVQITPNGPLDLIRSAISGLIGFNIQRRDFHFVMCKPIQKDMEQISTLFKDGKIKLHISKKIPFGDAVPKALEEMKTFKTVGKIVVTM